MIVFDDSEPKVRDLDFKVVCAECGEELEARFDGDGDLNVEVCGCQEDFR